MTESIFHLPAPASPALATCIVQIPHLEEKGVCEACPEFLWDRGLGSSNPAGLDRRVLGKVFARMGWKKKGAHSNRPLAGLPAMEACPVALPG